MQIAIDRIREFEPPEGYYVAFSGGKDSVVILDLVKRAGVKFDAHYNLTTVDPPELVRFIREQHPEVEKVLPELTMWQLIEKMKMPPLRQARYCCAILKEGGGKGRHVITGVRWAESTRRSKRRMVEVCMKDSTRIYLHPVIDWSESEIWEYIHKNKLPYCSLYDEGFKRLGCILCPMNRHPEEQIKRWPKIAEMYRITFRKIWPKVKKKRHATADEWFEWWISRDGENKQDPDQTVMFE